MEDELSTPCRRKQAKLGGKALTHPHSFQQEGQAVAFFQRFPVLVVSPLLCLSVVLLALGGQTYLTAKQQALQKAKQSFFSAISSSRAYLASHLYAAVEILMDKNVDPYARDHSLLANLGLPLKHGELDALALYDATDCSVLAKVSLIKEIPFDCADLEGGQASGLFWQKAANGKGVMAARIPLRRWGYPHLWLVGKLLLGRDWLGVFPELKPFDRSLWLRVGGQHEAAATWSIAEEGHLANGESGVALWSQHWLLRRLTLPLEAYLRSCQRLLLAFSLWSFLLMGLAFLAWRARSLADRRRQKAFIVWCRDLVKGQHLAVASDGLDNSWGEMLAASDYHEVCHELKLCKQEEALQNKQFFERYHNLQGHCQKLEEENEGLRRQLAHREEHSSLACQVQQAALSMVENLQKRRDHISDLSDGILAAMLADSRRLLNLLQAWQFGISTLGSRKFIRSLCEQASGPGDKHLLSEQIDAFLEVGNKLIDQALHFSSSLRLLQKDEDLCLQTLSQWYALAQGQLAPERLSLGLGEVLQAVALQFQWQREVPLFAFELAKEIEAMALPPKLGIVWYACFFHILGFLLEGQRGGEKLRTLVSSKQQQGYQYLFLTFYHPQRERKQLAYKPESLHWRKVQNLLLPFGISVAFLPKGDAGITLSLAWEKADCEQDGRSASLAGQ